MANNFEYYKDDILKILKEGGNFCLVDKKIKKCSAVSCSECDFREGSCTVRKLRWLYSEHIEQPKLTKKERLFCELAETGWIARDKNNVLHWYSAKPYKSTSIWISSINCSFPYLGYNSFPIIQWSDTEPWAVEDLLKLDVGNGG